MGISNQNDQGNYRRPRFWLGPLLAGLFFAVGYGITRRIFTPYDNQLDESVKLFLPKKLPGIGVEKFIKLQHLNRIGSNSLLNVESSKYPSETVNVKFSVPL